MYLFCFKNFIMNVDTIHEINLINNINSIILENNNITQNFVYENFFHF